MTELSTSATLVPEPAETRRGGFGPDDLERNGQQHLLPQAIPRVRARLASIALTLALAACSKDSTPPLVATTVTPSVTSLSFDAIGATQVVSATVRDQNGAVMTSVTPTFASSASSVASVASVASGPSATVTAVANGSASITVLAGSATASIPVTVAQAAVAPVKVAGDLQTATVGAALGTPLTVKIQDRLGHAMAGRTVTFTPGAGSGAVGPTSTNSGADGTATTIWTLGTVPGAQTVSATVAGLSDAATFTATANVGAAAAIAVSAGNSQTAIAGAAVSIALAVRVADAFNNPVPGVSVSFVAAAGSGTIAGSPAATNAQGIATAGTWTLGTLVGTKTVTATVTGLTPVTFTATATVGPAAIVAVNAGNSQTATVAQAVATLPSVKVTDANGNVVQGAAVAFAVASGGGSATGTSTTTNAGGIATVGGWTLGSTAGTNTLTATLSGSGIAGNPVTFTATGTAASVTHLTIELRYLTTGTASQVAAFTAAQTRWQNIITMHLSNVLLNAGAGQCGSNSPAISEIIHDIVIYVTFEAIDGVGGVLGSAGPCYIRDPNNLPLLGRMRFDTADLANMEANGTLNSVILHEMGHVLGIGTIWDQFPGLLVNPSLPSSPGVDTRFTGTNAIAGFDAIGGTTYTGGGKVPVENAQGGAGTRDSHWRESVLLNELMTGFVSAANNPLSLLTVRSLQDLGYTVNTSLADAFFLTLTTNLMLDSGPRVHMVNDVVQDDIKVVDDRGRIVRVLMRRKRP